MSRIYNAHTTASDALYLGVPIITVPGESFASRVASSLVLQEAFDVQQSEASEAEEGLTLLRNIIVLRHYSQFARAAKYLAENREILNVFRQRMAQRRQQKKFMNSRLFAKGVERLARLSLECTLIELDVLPGKISATTLKFHVVVTR